MSLAWRWRGIYHVSRHGFVMDTNRLVTIAQCQTSTHYGSHDRRKYSRHTDI